MFRKTNMRAGLRLSLLLLVSLIMWSCQKDDICPPGTATTPLLQIEFYDVQDPDRLKAVQNLLVIAEGEERVFLGPTTTNNISIPLRTDENVTRYRFIMNSGSETENEDLVTFTYDPDPEYLNRACGFKMNFTDMNVTRQEDGDRWLQSELVIVRNIQDETEVHISFTH